MIPFTVTLVFMHDILYWKWTVLFSESALLHINVVNIANTLMK